MSKALRKTPRRPVNAVAYLYTTDGWPMGECRLKDVSAGGAKLIHSIADELPNEFFLSFSRDGRVRRRCQLAWRGESQMGVRFVAAQSA
jgi:hypothetical protein